ncbi:MAG: polysaccharide deacetylase family protein [Candidatus Zixiibacteriota bacterium]|nr:MAG: polysaccharide deacetylase family protein [candidate division Zixibacteria bacterium]
MSGIRRFIKYLTALALFYSGLLSLYDFIRKKLGNRPDFVILMYHRVLDDVTYDRVYTQPGMSVTESTFDRQMTWLNKKFKVLPIEQVLSTTDNGESGKYGAAAITFDDGWRDNYTHALPILRKHRIPATVFLTADYIGTSRPFWFLTVKWLILDGNISAEDLAAIITDIDDRSKSATDAVRFLRNIRGTPETVADRIIEMLKTLEIESLEAIVKAMLDRSSLSLDRWERDKPMLTWDEAAEMSEQNIEIGSHGCSHRILTLLSESETSKELHDSRAAIESRLGKAVRGFSYPNGNYSEEIEQDVRKAGYTYAVATGGRNLPGNQVDRFALKRVAIHEGISTGPWGRFSTAMFAWHIIRHF